MSRFAQEQLVVAIRARYWTFLDAKKTFLPKLQSLIGILTKNHHKRRRFLPTQFVRLQNQRCFRNPTLKQKQSHFM